MKVSMSALQRRMADVLMTLGRHGSVVVTYRGKERALLRALPEEPATIADSRDDPAFGMWRDREDMNDPPAAVRRARKERRQTLTGLFGQQPR